MKYFLLFFFFVSFCAQAQDTLIYKVKSKKLVVNILYTTDDEVIYKKMKDKVERSFIVSKSQLRAIAFRDSTVQIFQEPNVSNDLSVLQRSVIDTAYQNRFMTLTPEQRKKLYEYGVLDAQDYYGIGDFASGRRHISGAAPLPGGGIVVSSEQDNALQYPNKVLFKYADYRKGYQDEAGRLNRKYRRQIAVVGLSVLLISFLVIKFSGQ